MQASDSNPQELRLAGDSGGLAAWQTLMGFVVADASLKPLFANNEAITILTYPRPSLHGLAHAFHKKVRPALLKVQGSAKNRSGAHTIVKLKSGRRTYLCRAFPLNGNGNGAGTLLLLERGISRTLALSQVSQQFQLTHREQQVVILLLQGLSNKEMAENMGISANTVKAFLRTAMLRMGVSKRAGIVIKILGLFLCSRDSEPSDRLGDGGG